MRLFFRICFFWGGGVPVAGSTRFGIRDSLMLSRAKLSKDPTTLMLKIATVLK